MTANARSSGKVFEWTYPRWKLIVGTLVFLLIGFNFWASLPSSWQSAQDEQVRREEEQRKRDAEAAFNRLTAAQHVELAELALKPDSTLEVIGGGLRHLRAVPPSAPEAPRAKGLERKLLRAQNLATAQNLIEASSTDDMKSVERLKEASTRLGAVLGEDPNDEDASRILRSLEAAGKPKLLEMTRKIYVSKLQDQLKGMGFNAIVWEKGEVLYWDCDLFRDTAYRVEFLAKLRADKRNLCEIGFRQIRLTQGKLLEIGQSYSLGCQ